VRTVEHWIDGAVTPGQSTRQSPVWNPATGQQQAQVALGSAADLDTAVSAAAKAFEQWSQVSLSRRTKIMFKFRELVNSHAKELA
jgi:malonate-semialdehyde dehydrogenase (acetylating) / methylmalonate-semialdehyde dehydrogenase